MIAIVLFLVIQNRNQINMVGKFFLIAFLCVSLTQVQGNEVENAIRNGLNKVKILYQGGQKRIDASIKEVEYKAKLIESKTVDFVIKSQDVQTRTAETIRNMAQYMEEKAKQSNKPESVFECIRKYEENANNQIETLTRKFETDMERLEKVKSANIETDTKPLYEKQAALKTRYERAIQIIEKCENAACVNTAVRSCGRWLDQMYADMRRILGQVSTILGNFQRDANNYFANSNRQINMIKSSALRNIRNCIFRRDAFLEEFGEFEEY